MEMRIQGGYTISILRCIQNLTGQVAAWYYWIWAEDMTEQRDDNMQTSLQIQATPRLQNQKLKLYISHSEDIYA